MMGSSLEHFTQRPVAVGVAYTALVVAGVVAFIRLPVDLGPAADPPALEVSTAWERVSAETVEEMITAPLEEIAGMIHGVRRINSVSEEGRSQVTIEFGPKTDMDVSRHILREQLAAFSERLPHGASAPSIRSHLPEGFRDLRGFLSYSLTGKWSLSVLREYAKEIIVPRLVSVEGVKSVDVFGGAEQEVTVKLFPDRMAALGISPDAVKEAFFKIQPGIRASLLRQGSLQAFVLMDNNLSSIKDLRRLVVAVTRGGAPVRLSDIAVIEEGQAAPGEIFRLNGKPAVVIRLDKESQVNMFHVAEMVEEMIQGLRLQLPEGMEIIRESDKNQDIRGDLGRLSHDIFWSALCIAIVLHVVLRNMRGSLIVLSSIASSLAATFLLFRVLSVSLYPSTLAGLALGFVRMVDNAIIVTNSIQSRSVQKGSHGILHALEATAGPLIVSTLITSGILIPPALLLHGVEPRLSDFALACGITLFSSLLVSLTFLPLVAGVFAVRWSAFPLPVYHRFFREGIYQRLLERLMRKRWWVIGIAVWAVGIPFWVIPDYLSGGNRIASLYNWVSRNRLARMVREHVYPILGGSSYVFAKAATFAEPWEPGGKTHILVRITLPQGAETVMYEKVVSVIEHAVTRYKKHLENTLTLITPVNAFVQINLKDSTSGTPIPLEVRDLLNRSAGRIGGAEIGVYGVGSGFAMNATAVPSFLVEVRGYRYGKVKEVAERFRQAIQKNPRITDVHTDGAAWSRSYREIVASIHREVLSRSGVTIEETVHALGRYTASTPAPGDIRLAGKILPLNVTYVRNHDFSVHDLESAVVTIGSGRTFRLSSLIAFEERLTEGRITRANQEYVRWIRCGYKGPHSDGERFLNLAVSRTNLPPGYSIQPVLPATGVPAWNSPSALWCILAMVSIVFMATAAFFESFAKAFVVLFSIPVSFTGTFLIFSLPSLSFGRSGYAVFLLITSITTTNAILFLNSLGKRVDSDGLSRLTVIGTASRRARTVLMATATTMGGIIPFLFLVDRGSTWHSLAWGIAGGLLTSFLAVMILVPVASSAVLKLEKHAEPGRAPPEGITAQNLR